MSKQPWWGDNFDGLNPISTLIPPNLPPHPTGTDDFLFQNISGGTDGPGGIWLMHTPDAGDPFGTAPLAEVAVPNSSPWDVLGSADFDGDTLNAQGTDIVEQNDTNGTIQILFMGGVNGTTVSGSTIIQNAANNAALVPGTDWHLAGTGSFHFSSGVYNQDDLIFQNTTTGAIGEWYLNPLSGGVITAFGDIKGGLHAVGANPGPTWHLIGDADFNNPTAPAGTPNVFGTSGPTTGFQPQYDLYFQNDNGSVGVWHIAGQDANGDPVVSAANALDGNPGPTWHLISVQGDFDGNGVNDLLFQNDNGAEAIWRMAPGADGTGTPTVAGEFFIGNPGAGWKVVGAGDYDGDGVVDDIRLQNVTTGQIGDQFLGNAPTPGQFGAPGVTAVPQIVGAGGPGDATPHVIDGNPGTSWVLLHDDFLLNT
jgi:hypothetical protein